MFIYRTRRQRQPKKAVEIPCEKSTCLRCEALYKSHQIIILCMCKVHQEEKRLESRRQSEKATTSSLRFFANIVAGAEGERRT